MKTPATSIAKIERKEIPSYQLVMFTWPPENLVTALLNDVWREFDNFSKEVSLSTLITITLDMYWVFLREN